MRCTSARVRGARRRAARFPRSGRLLFYGAITVTQCKFVCCDVRLLVLSFRGHYPTIYFILSIPFRNFRRFSWTRPRSSIFPCVASLIPTSLVSVQSKVRCSEQMMEVDIVRTSPQAKIYLQQMKDFPGKERFVSAAKASPYRRGRETCHLFQTRRANLS